MSRRQQHAPTRRPPKAAPPAAPPQREGNSTNRNREDADPSGWAGGASDTTLGEGEKKPAPVRDRLPIESEKRHAGEERRFAARPDAAKPAADAASAAKKRKPRRSG